MHITPVLLSIPPYISTTWENVLSLRTEKGILYITLKTGESIPIPHLTAAQQAQIFQAHASYLQHANPFILHNVDLPAEIAEQLSAIAQAFNLPQTEDPQEEEIPDNELTFRDWDIRQTGDKLYTVTSRLDTSEQYNVFLGNPLGCTCGHDHCEHIKSVLES
jgi:hypothetical protein